MNTAQHYDVIVVGSGAAGLGLALSIAHHAKVAVFSKNDLLEGSSNYAQGGIAAVMSQDDNLNSHIDDTMKAGAGLCHRDVVEFTVKNAKSAIEWLMKQGVQFTTQKNHELHLTQEGGHSHRRILHVADKTGSAVVHTLSEQVLHHNNIDCFTDHTVIDLCIDNKKIQGITVLDNHQHQLKIFTAQYVVLATGGASHVYLHTTNPESNSGDGVAMAWRVGCRIANMEFNQFHPTCFYAPNTKPFLITEAIRGEGGLLLLPNKERFMPRYHKDAELAPRDIVTRAIHHEMEKNQLSHVYLDISHKPAAFIKEFFPTIYQQCLQHGVDITQSPIPVVPAAHYTCGGIMTDLQGKTDIKNLYAIGEVAFTGLHGANRMASNSLLECLVFAKSAAQDILQRLNSTLEKTTSVSLPKYTISHSNAPHCEKELLQLRKTLWNNVGIIRSNQKLFDAQKIVEKLRISINQTYEQGHIDKSLLELRNLVEVAYLIIECALQRKESRGLHYNTDYPNLSEIAQDTIVSKSSANNPS